MGFLWTLTALTHAVILAPQKSPTHVSMSPTEVFMAFGYALSTTLVGMLLRVLVIQFQETLPDRILAAQEDIEQRVAALTGQLQGATHDLESFRETARQGLKEHLDDLTNSLTRIQLEIEGSHSQASRIYVERLQTAMDALIEHLNSFRLPHDKIKSESTKLIEQLTKSGEKLDVAMSRLEAQLLQCAEELKIAGKSLSDRLNSIDISPDVFLRQVSTITDITERSVAAFGAVGNKLGTVSDQLSNMAAILDKFRNSLETLETLTVRLSSHGVADATRRIADIERIILDTRMAGEQLQSTVKEVLDFIRRQLESNRIL